MLTTLRTYSPARVNGAPVTPMGDHEVGLPPSFGQATDGPLPRGGGIDDALPCVPLRGFQQVLHSHFIVFAARVDPENAPPRKQSAEVQLRVRARGAVKPGLPYLVSPGNVGERETVADVVRAFKGG